VRRHKGTKKLHKPNEYFIVEGMGVISTGGFPPGSARPRPAIRNALSDNRRSAVICLTVLENARGPVPLPFAFAATAIPAFHPPCRSVDLTIHGSAALILRARAASYGKRHRSRGQKWTPLNESSLFRHSGHARKQNRTASPGLSD